jgi:hypothetical protein
MTMLFTVLVEREYGILSCGIIQKKVKNVAPPQLKTRKNICKLLIIVQKNTCYVVNTVVCNLLFRLDGIVLSPQGRSFARGCQVNVDKGEGGEGRSKISGRLGRGWDATPREKGHRRGRVSFYYKVFISTYEYIFDVLPTENNYN